MMNNLQPLTVLFLIILIFAIKYLALILYFEYREDKINKEYEKRNGKKTDLSS
jgi:uncharacterized membrane protein